MENQLLFNVQMTHRWPFRVSNGASSLYCNLTVWCWCNSLLPLTVRLHYRARSIVIFRVDIAFSNIACSCNNIHEVVSRYSSASFTQNKSFDVVILWSSGMLLWYLFSRYCLPLDFHLSWTSFFKSFLASWRQNQSNFHSLRTHLPVCWNLGSLFNSFLRIKQCS